MFKSLLRLSIFPFEKNYKSIFFLGNFSCGFFIRGFHREEICRLVRTWKNQSHCLAAFVN